MRFASLRGRTAVVTGAAGTMGRAVALALRTDGLRVVGLDVRPAKGCVVCDISDPDAVAHAMRRIGRVDV
ncbi:MAG TPA: NAD-dependent epimerase/dehydratase family protein, partial [Aestuariivirgaceae bacterium]|nr:NAD-dependent epimerase/dehydratase family protein [Aestuariivirgaceae bacterium]